MSARLSDFVVALLIAANAMMFIHPPSWRERIGIGIYVFWITFCVIHIRTLYRDIIAINQSINDSLNRMNKQD